MTAQGAIVGGRRMDGPELHHWLRCDGFGRVCCAAAGPAETAEEARKMALKEGWQFDVTPALKQLCRRCANRRVRFLDERPREKGGR